MGRKPDDFYKTFCGNIDDGFKIGISVTKKAVKLYTDFYSSDILIASPLGLRLVLETDADFLSSIELLVMDQVLTDLQLILGNGWEANTGLVQYSNGWCPVGKCLIFKDPVYAFFGYFRSSFRAMARNEDPCFWYSSIHANLVNNTLV